MMLENFCTEYVEICNALDIDVALGNSYVNINSKLDEYMIYRACIVMDNIEIQIVNINEIIPLCREWGA